MYDPVRFDDPLLLGLKGTMSEAELHVIKARLRGGIMNKVRRGEYRCVLPTGFAYQESGNVVLDPDLQIRRRSPISSKRSCASFRLPAGQGFSEQQPSLPISAPQQCNNDFPAVGHIDGDPHVE